MTTPAPARRTLDATVWMAAGRALGIGWRVVIVAALGIADFGVYAVVLAVAALISMPLEAYYVVREPRTDDDAFAGDRAARWWLGVAGALAGAAIVPWAALPGLVVFKAGTDIAFNAHCSTMLRHGRPDTGYRLETVRQVAGVVAGGAYLVLADDPAIATLVLATFLGSAPFSLLAWPAVRGVRPARPEPTRRTASIVLEACGSAAYIQGDIVVLAALAGPEAAGYYSFGSVVVWVIALVGRNLGVTYHRPLREAGGDVAAGPPLVQTTALAALGALGTGAIAVGCLLAGAPRDLWLTFALLVLVASTRVYSAVFATVLIVQGRDGLRLVATLAGVVVKLVLVAVLAGYGAPGAAIAFVAADLLVTLVCARALYAEARP